MLDAAAADAAAYAAAAAAALRPGEAVYVATDEGNRTFFAPLEARGHRVYVLADVLRAVAATPGLDAPAM